MFLSGVDGDSEALELVKAGGAYKLSIAFAWALMGYGLGQFGADWIEGKEVPQLIVAKGVQARLRRRRRPVHEMRAPTRRACSPTEPAYEKYLPLYGNVSHATRTPTGLAGRPARWAQPPEPLPR